MYMVEDLKCILTGYQWQKLSLFIHLHGCRGREP